MTTNAADPPYTRTPEEDFVRECYYEYHTFHYQQIRAALGRLDRARARLVAAQNNLAHLLGNLHNPYSERRFAEFYAGGGITAGDWKRSYEEQEGAYQEDMPFKPRGQLRVVYSGEVT